MGLVAPGDVSWVRNSIYPAPAGVPIPALVPILVGLVLSIVGWTMVNTWVYNSTESVLLMILLHGWYNTVDAYLVLSSQNALAQTLSGILPWALAIVLLRAYGGEHLAARPRPRVNSSRRPAGGRASGRLSERPG